MARKLPKAPKVYTTTYESFRGVDFTNDQTNVWRKRSPSAVNMLPDASGRPFKRHGWDVLLSNEDICTALSVGECKIKKCAYFELAGVDHIVVFTDAGVLFYNGDENATTYTTVGVTAISTDYDCYSGFDRSFFFEGNGTAAFYIYGNFKVWRYEDDFTLHNVTSQITVPTVMAGTSANGTGTLLNGFNLLGTKARVEYNECLLFDWWSSDGISVTVKESFKTGKTIGNPSYYHWKWNGSAWTVISGGLAFPSSDIDVQGTKTVNDEIIVIYSYGVRLPSNVPQSQLSDVKAWSSRNTQFDFELEVVGSGGAETWAMLYTDPITHTDPRAWIDFVDNWADNGWGESGEDFIRVEYPTVNIETTTYTNQVSQDTAILVGA